MLDKAFRDLVRQVKCITVALARMETLPGENGKKGMKGQVELYIELESLMKNMLLLTS